MLDFFKQNGFSSSLVIGGIIMYFYTRYQQYLTGKLKNELTVAKGGIINATLVQKQADIEVAIKQASIVEPHPQLTKEEAIKKLDEI